jgi:DNA-directed RNA polymerase subunit RPC12/RpoP
VKNICFDADNNARCWNCGSKGFTEKRTFRSKVMGLGVGSLATKQKMKCQRCGKYNDPGNGRPYDGPRADKYRKEREAEQAQRGTA